MSSNRQLRLFIRQPFTEVGDEQKALVGEVMTLLEESNGHPRPFEYLTGNSPESAGTFTKKFEATSGKQFTPQAFRDHRLALLRQADVFVNVRVAMSESTAFELAYHIYEGARSPILFLVWTQAPIRTTLLRELEALCPTTYLQFEHPSELRTSLQAFFDTLPSVEARHA